MTKYSVKKISHRLSSGVIHHQKVLKSVLMINLPFKSLKVPALFMVDSDMVFCGFFLITAIKNIRSKFSLGLMSGGNHSLGGVRGRDACRSVFCYSNPMPRWAALWASALSKMVLVYWNADHRFIFFSEIFLPVIERYCENEMPSCGRIFISQAWGCFSEKLVPLSLQLGDAK